MISEVSSMKVASPLTPRRLLRGGECEVAPIRWLIKGDRDAKHVGRKNCFISVITTITVQREDLGERRRGSSLFKNMPFLPIEDALLAARRASS